MDRGFIAGLVLVCVCFGVVLSATFNESLPGWCARPAGNGNWIVHSLGLCRQALP